jgi:hypothetical protein
MDANSLWIHAVMIMLVWVPFAALAAILEGRAETHPAGWRQRLIRRPRPMGPRAPVPA